MLSEITVQQRRAAQTLSQSSCWPKLKEMLDAELGSIFVAMTSAMNPVVVHQLQGRAKALSELLGTILEASTDLEKIERRPSGLGI
jgi:hypothetical protein